METYDNYITYVDEVADKYSLAVIQEHEQIHEFLEGENIPLFKLVYGPTNLTNNENVVVATFHLDLDPVDAIQWYSRLYTIIPNLRLQSSYYKDDRGETFIGEHAENVRHYKLEQKVITEWMESKRNDEDAKRFAESKILGRVRNKKQPFLDKDKALEEFRRSFNPDEDEIN